MFFVTHSGHPSAPILHTTSIALLLFILPPLSIHIVSSLESSNHLPDRIYD